MVRRSPMDPGRLWRRFSRTHLHMVFAVLAAAAVLATLPGLSSRQKPPGVFDVAGRAPDSAIITIGSDRPADDGPTSPMLDQTRGILDRLTKPECLELRASAVSAVAVTPSDPPTALSHLCVVHVAAGKLKRDIEVLRGPQGEYFAREIGPVDDKDAPTIYRLDAPKFARIAARLPGYRGEFLTTKATPAPGKAVVMVPPYTPGVYYMEREVLGDRFLGGRTTSLTTTKRDLTTEPLLVRLPKNYDPKTPCGVLVYVDPGERAILPPTLFAGADDLGLIMVGAENTGNGVYVADRWQLVLDGLATVAERHLIDSRRVYITGISGGGQISTHIVVCFPDIFSGAVPIVALGSYENIPTGTGKMWQGTFGKPRAPTLRIAQTHRIAAITGAKDFNQRIIHLAADLLKRDGFTIRVDDYDDMGHTAPTAPRFRDALRWIDEPYRKTREAELSAASEAMKRFTAQPPADPAARQAALVDITRAAPWSPEAWSAIDILNGKPVPGNTP